MKEYFGVIALLSQTKEIFAATLEYLSIADLISFSAAHPLLRNSVRSSLFFVRAKSCLDALAGPINLISVDIDCASYANFDLLPHSKFTPQCRFSSRKWSSFEGVNGVIQEMATGTRNKSLLLLQEIFQDPAFKKQVAATRVAWGYFYFAFFIFPKSRSCVPLCFELIATSYGEECEQVFKVLRPVFDCCCFEREPRNEIVSVCSQHHVPDAVAKYASVNGSWTNFFNPPQHYYDFLVDGTEAGTLSVADRLADSLLCTQLLSDFVTLEDFAGFGLNPNGCLEEAQENVSVILGTDRAKRRFLREKLVASFPCFEQMCEFAKDLPIHKLQLEPLYTRYKAQAQKKSQEEKEDDFEHVQMIVQLLDEEINTLRMEDEYDTVSVDDVSERKTGNISSTETSSSQTAIGDSNVCWLLSGKAPSFSSKRRSTLLRTHNLLRIVALKKLRRKHFTFK